MHEYHCHACGLVMDRDENAARNIENEAARSADSSNGRGDEVRPGALCAGGSVSEASIGKSGSAPLRLEQVRTD